MSDAGDSLQDEFDVIVLGTGLTESIVAAACARAGKSVLHLDSNDYYGSDWASFWFTSWNDWLKYHSTCNKNDTLYHNIEKINYIPEKSDDSTIWSIEKLDQLSNKFAIDLTPRLIYSDGPMTQLLLQSNICRYLSFKECSHFLLACPGEAIELKEIPCTRSDVFNDRTLSLHQKRKLMKFIDEFEKISSQEVDLNGSFEKFLQKYSLDPFLVNVIKCVSLSTGEHSSIGDAVKKVNLFTKSSGRYGKTPFLWTMYGSGELPQAFCRLCAVFGGFYCLKCDLLDATYVEVTNDENTKSKVTNESEKRENDEDENEDEDKSADAGQQWKIKVKLKSHSTISASGSCDEKSVSCKYLVSSVHSCSKKFLKQLHKQWQEEVKKEEMEEKHKKDQTATMEGGIMESQREKEKDEEEKNKSQEKVNSSHVVCLTTKSITKADESGNQVTFAIFPTGIYGQDIEVISDVTFIQLSSSTCTVPTGLYLLYGSCTNTSNDRSARQLLQPLINKLFTQPSSSTGQGSSCPPEKSSQDQKNNEQEQDTSAHDDTTFSNIQGEIVSCYYFDKRVASDHSDLLRYEANQLFVLSPPSADHVIDYESAIQQAHSVFTTMFPHDDFLAKAPDSEDIIFDDVEPCSQDTSDT